MYGAAFSLKQKQVAQRNDCREATFAERIPHQPVVLVQVPYSSTLSSNLKIRDEICRGSGSIRRESEAWKL